jgi:hypothetical protein
MRTTSACQWPSPGQVVDRPLSSTIHGTESGRAVGPRRKREGYIGAFPVLLRVLSVPETLSGVTDDRPPRGWTGFWLEAAFPACIFALLALLIWAIPGDRFRPIVAPGPFLGSLLVKFIWTMLGKPRP